MSLRRLCLVLEEQLRKGRETDLAIVFSLGKIADSAAAEALLRIERGAQDKDLKKEIRRSLFKLSQKGLTIPEDKRVEEKSPTPTPEPIAGDRSLHVSRRRLRAVVSCGSSSRRQAMDCKRFRR